MLPQKHNVVKYYFDLHLPKGFIQVSLAFYSSLVFLGKKPGERIRFCINYQKLNTITKKNAIPYLLLRKF